MRYETVIGLEVHLQLSTESKVFCGCSAKFGQSPNSQACPVCLGLPGTLPVLNKKVLEYGIKVALSLNCAIADMLKFDRKNYFYPDLPKDFQISQYDKPLANHGYIFIKNEQGEKKIGITRVHIEEDAGKLVHPENKDFSLVDFNRTGVPLLEIVSEPDLNSPEEAYEYLTALKSILEYLDVSTCNMEEGSLRCDANLSLRPVGEKKLGTKIELKNMNSFKGVKNALAYEVKRQAEALDKNEKMVQETRLWDEQRGVTVSMRTKEEAHDYRYFPEPDLVPFYVDKDFVEKVKKEMPELPQQKIERFTKEYGLSAYDAGLLAQSRHVAGYFEECAEILNDSKAIANWLNSDLAAYANAQNKRADELGLSPKNLAGMIKLIKDNTISGKIAKEILPEMIKTKKSAAEIVRTKGLAQISDAQSLEKLADEVLAENEKTVQDYASGKETAVTFLVGKFMQKTKGKANPGLANEILKKKLKEKTGK